MEFNEFKTNFEMTIETIFSNKEAATNESQTISYLVAPLIAALGYSSTNPNEYRTEVTVKTPFKDINETSKIDIILYRQGNPLMFVEAESQKGDLVKKGITQVTSVLPHAQKELNQQELVGVLTDGVRYMFFADFVPDVSHKPKPFKELQLDDMDLDDYEFLFRVAKNSFSFDWLRNKYEQKTKLTNVRESVEFLMNNPTDSFVRAVLEQMKEQGKISGNITKSVISDYKPSVISSLSEVLTTNADYDGVTKPEKIDTTVDNEQVEFPVKVHLPMKKNPEVDIHALLLNVNGKIRIVAGSHFRNSDIDGETPAAYEHMLSGERVLLQDVEFDNSIEKYRQK